MYFHLPTNIIFMTSTDTVDAQHHVGTSLCYVAWGCVVVDAIILNIQ